MTRLAHEVRIIHHLFLKATPHTGPNLPIKLISCEQKSNTFLLI